MPATPAGPYPNKMTVIYPDDIAVIHLNKAAAIYFNKAANLLKLKNQRGIRFLYPEISKRLGGITREMINRLIYPGVNEES